MYNDGFINSFRFRHFQLTKNKNNKEIPNNIKIDPELANNLFSDHYKLFIGTQLALNVTNIYNIRNKPKLQNILFLSSKSTKQTIEKSITKDGKLIKK